jgi:hypothetical protein
MLDDGRLGGLSGEYEREEREYMEVGRWGIVDEEGAGVMGARPDDPEESSDVVEEPVLSATTLSSVYARRVRFDRVGVASIGSFAAVVTGDSTERLAPGTDGAT